jgi:hypothetical protein
MQRTKNRNNIAIKSAYSFWIKVVCDRLEVIKCERVFTAPFTKRVFVISMNEKKICFQMSVWYLLEMCTKICKYLMSIGWYLLI